jgi:methionine-S-sulfoxide reductase
MSKTTQKALFAAGCFWGVQFYFDQVPGVTKTTAGYSGGHTSNPTYEEVCTHTTGHAESVLVEFDPPKISYPDLLKHFFRLHNPTTLNQDGPNFGDSYRSQIFYYDAEQKTAALKAKDEAQKDWQDPIVTKIEPAREFYQAEAYHQKFSQRTGQGMCHVGYAPVS